MEHNDHLRTYFISQGRALNKSGLNDTLGLATRCVHDWLAGKINLPANARPKVEAWARRYGYDENIQYEQIV